MQNNPFDDEPPLIPTIIPPTLGDDAGGFYPYPDAPAKPPRTMGRWFVLGGHVMVFIIALIFILPINPSNDFRLLLTGWGGVVVVHTLITCLFDIREGIVGGRRIKRAQRQAEVMEKRARMLEKLNKPE
jgi:uncharacterized integral membrane protein